MRWRAYGILTSVWLLAAPGAAQDDGLEGDAPPAPVEEETEPPADEATEAPSEEATETPSSEEANATREPADEATASAEPTATTVAPVVEPPAETEPPPAPAEPAPQDDDDAPRSEPEFGIRATAELGFLAVLKHDIRLGTDGTYLDYVNDGGQSNLFFFARVSVEVDIWRQHHITFLYQPLELTSDATLRRDLRIDGLDFPAGRPVRFFYGFPFFRFSWDFDVLEGRDELLAFGLGLQIRNADIAFQSLDGELYRARNDIGPVPLLRARGRFPIDAGFFFAFEADGFYAPISVLNGSDTEVTGAIADVSLRFGWRFIEHVDAFLNVRYLAGGAVGDGDPTPTSDGRQENWLHFLTLSLGATIDSRP